MVSKWLYDDEPNSERIAQMNDGSDGDEEWDFSAAKMELNDYLFRHLPADTTIGAMSAMSDRWFYELFGLRLNPTPKEQSNEH